MKVLELLGAEAEIEAENQILAFNKTIIGIKERIGYNIL